MSLKRFIFIFSWMSVLSSANAQLTSKAIVLEHFTNSRCSICANRNPALLQNLASHPQVLNLSIHPSSPFANCFLSQRNAIVNDSRTNFYGIYGGTPRIVINGVVQTSGVNFGAPSIFSPFQQDSTAFSMEVSIEKEGIDTIIYRVKIIKLAPESIESAFLFSGLSQDTIFGNGGNGELAHHQVLVAANQEIISLPMQINDSLIITKRLAVLGVWDLTRLAAFGILQQNPQRALIQAARSDLLTSSLQTSTKDIAINATLRLYPNPTAGILKSNQAEPFSFRLYTLQGDLLQKGASLAGEIKLRDDLSSGLYLIQLTTESGENHTRKVLLKK